MTINVKDASTKTVLLTVAVELDKRAVNDKVLPRRSALLAVATALQKLANGRYVTRLLDYME